MNDRLMIAAMAMQGLLQQTEASRCEYDAVAEFALEHTDALLAAAGEPFPVKTGCDDCRERAEASESKLAACERERDRSQSFAEGLQAELTEAIDARNAAEQSKERLAENLRKTRAARFVWEQEAEAASIVIAALKRRLEPLTEEEATEVMRPVIYGSLPPTDDQIRSIVDDADRIRSRRQP